MKKKVSLADYNLDNAKIKPKVIQETAITKKIIEYLNSLPKCKAIKRHLGGYGSNGEPDICGCLDSIHLEIEVKRPGNKPTPLQQERIKEWLEAGAISGVVYSVDDTKKLIEDYYAKRTYQPNLGNRNDTNSKGNTRIQEACQAPA